jgi:molecular chaperone DnaK (HSP70)
MTYALGIDLGTTYTAAASARAERERALWAGWNWRVVGV